MSLALARAGIQWNRNCIYDRKIYDLVVDYSVMYANFGSWDMSHKQIVIIYNPIESRPWSPSCGDVHEDGKSDKRLKPYVP